MKIRKKTPKAASSKPPLFLIGYSFTAPAPEEIRMWFDLNYGGPLAFQPEGSTGTWSAKHGPWHARVKLTLTEEEREALLSHASWDHRSLAAVAPTSAAPNNLIDTILLAARLARGLTLLTQGTTLDLMTQTYTNPSDWNDRGLSTFQLQDHILVTQDEALDPSLDWLHTLGLGKFGLDELELMQPRGLPIADRLNLLAETAEQVLRAGKNSSVGSTIEIPTLGRHVTIVKHRTAAPAGWMLAFRQISI